MDVERVVPWVGLLPQFVCRYRLLQFSRSFPVVVCLDVEPLPFAYFLPQLVSLADVLGLTARLAEVAVHGRQGAVGHGEIRVEFYGPLEERNGRGVTFRKEHLPSQTVGFQCLQRRRGCVLDGCGVFLHRAERFAELAAQADGCVAQSFEHCLLARSLLLRLRQHLAGAAVRGFQADDVLAAEAGNRAGQHGLAAGALTDFSGDLGRQAVAGRTAHQFQSLIHLALGKKIEKGRLSELHRQSLLERIVEDRIARLIVEIGKNNGVFFGEAPGLMMRPKIKPAR